MRPGLPVNSSVTSVGNDLLEADQQAKAIRQGDKGMPPQHGLAQNAAIHREGEAGALAKPFMARGKGSVTKPCSIKALIHQGR
ncbi:hypothetical protein CesoFtcFv8_017655 [Champsocephalus esox]|uniref:Uncharacterized protein n=2 Tax=Champsocephalus TaxID=52236 RepID=A0AAN8HJ11_CHAGU|nr:hypothetical protein CesoFtcFv8_017655 [Champsocephalus esox]KAK5917108.1 hypothetical protein CgunFtcFv8_012026 [Champsocephalus gunnari]